ncbi:MAG TPA: inositol monophosphatase family protein [Actinomycetota bacterium]|jgi:myo-inositol-1(or 4)-monophosphatase|nr:inositol monophosphatase family protein [Actinomycetota bacterium]
MTTGTDELLSVAVGAARAAARIHAEGRRSALDVAEKDASPFNLVTHVDRAAEEAIVDRILEARPDDAILGEEGGARDGTSGVRWIVDPLDGTANYVYGYPAYAVSIGIEIGDEPALGVVLDSSRDVLLAGGRDVAATANGLPIHATALDDPATALLSTGYAFDPAYRSLQGAVTAAILSRVRDLRRTGSAAIDLCSVATGAVDGYFEAALSPWDAAGGAIIARAAGAEVLVGTTNDVPGVAVLAANARLLERLAPMLAEAGFTIRPA